MNKKHIFIGLFFVLFATGNIFAQDNFLNMDFALPNTFGFNDNIQIDFMADGEAVSAGPRLTGSPFLAGLSNTVFGLWSWMNKDWVGGGVTAGMEVVGLAMWMYGLVADSQGGGLIAFPGMILTFGGAIWGGIRASRQCKQMNATSLAEAISDNPLNHISVVALPTLDERTMTGSLTYSVSF